MISEIAAAIDKPCQFANWHFDPTDGQLKSKQQSQRLQPRHAKLLAIFVANSGVLISRQDLISLLWQDKSVNEDALSRCVAELRSLLGDKSQQPIFIETVPKKGYRFIQSLEVESTDKNLFFWLGFLLVTIAIVIGYQSFNSSSPNSQPSSNNQSSSKSAPIDSSSELIQSFKSAIIASRRVTTDTKLEHQPQISHQGDKLAFTVVKQGKLRISVINLAGNELHEIADDKLNLYSATFSNNGNQLLVAGLKDSSCKILLYQLPSLEREVLDDCYLPIFSSIFDWSANDNQFVFTAPTSQQSDQAAEPKAAIWHFDLISKQATQLTNPEGLDIFDSQPKFSADGRQIAFTRGSESIRHVYTIKNPFTQHLQPLRGGQLDSKLVSCETVPNGKVTQINQGHGYISGFDWLKDNNHIIFDSNELGDRNLWIVDLDNRQQHLIGARDAQYPSLNSDNSLLAFREIRYNANIWRVDLTDKLLEKQRIIRSIKYNNFPSYSPDGKQIAFVSNRQGKSAVWLYDSTTKLQTNLLSIPDHDLFTPSWSSNGSKLLISSRGKAGYYCFILDINSGKHQKIKEFSLPHSDCHYSKNGDIFALSKVPSKPSQLLKLKQNGELKTLPPKGLNRIQIAANEKIVFSLAEKKGLYSVDYNGKNENLLIADFSQSHYGHWTVRDGLLYYPKIAEENVNGKTLEKGIWRKDLISGQESLATKELPSSIGQTLSVSPDHRHLLISQTDSTTADIYLAKIK